jgi:hypothetical protein
MRILQNIYGWLLRLLPIALAALGWRIDHWVGMFAGVLLGCILALVIWGSVYYCLLSARLKRQMQNAAKLPTERLIELAEDPTSREMAFAMGELQKRGIDARPTRQSLCELLTSPQSNRRGLGMSLLFGMYPDFWAKISEGSSSGDPPEVWRSRLAAVRDG